MKLTVEIDPSSGFCNGVVRAVEVAEKYLSTHDRLYSLGAIVHNSQEIARLEGLGLHSIGYEKMNQLEGDTVLVRAHGEPPSTYHLATANNIEIIDCTCPVVLRLQKKIAAEYVRLLAVGGKIVIFGKRGHAEVNGLVGQTEGSAVVIENISEIENIDFSVPLALFSQTTKDPQQYSEVAAAIRARVADENALVVHETICRQVASRHSHLESFAKEHDVVIFVSGRESSNGKVLFELCRRSNLRSYWVETERDLDMEWFCDGDRVGICGATSTPRWQLEKLLCFLGK